MRLLLLLLPVLALSGCGYLFGDDGLFRDRSRDYQDSAELPVMKVPGGVTTGSLDEIYAIPPITAERDLRQTDEVPRPDPLLAASAEQMVRIQRLGEDSWALIGIPPGQLWPQVRSFLSAASIPIDRIDAQAGLIESAFVELQGQERPARFRFRVERGVQRGNSELHVLQMFAGTSDWPADSDDTELESEMLRSVAQFIANSADTAPVSMMAEQSISASGRVATIEEDGNTFLRLELPFDRAWASLARALEVSGFEITDRNRSAGQYFVTYSGEDEDEDDSGWFNWFGGDDDEVPLKGVPLLVSLREEASGSMAIDLEREEGGAVSETTEILALLQLLKGNIN